MQSIILSLASRYALSTAEVIQEIESELPIRLFRKEELEYKKMRNIKRSLSYVFVVILTMLFIGCSSKTTQPLEQIGDSFKFEKITRIKKNILTVENYNEVMRKVFKLSEFMKNEL